MLKWTDLRSAGNSFIARLTIVVPVIGSVLIYEDTFRAAVSRALGQQAYSAFGSPKLYAMYFGLFAFGVGSTIYQLFCREVIKNFGAPEEYVSAVAAHVPRRRLLAMVSEMRRAAAAPVDLPIELISQQTSRPGAVDDPRTRNEILDAYFEYLNVSRRAARFCIGTLYFIGVTLVGVTSLATALQVAVLAWTAFARN